VQQNKCISAHENLTQCNKITRVQFSAKEVATTPSIQSLRQLTVQQQVHKDSHTQNKYHEPTEAIEMQPWNNKAQRLPI
jgi:hypothetical protein